MCLKIGTKKIITVQDLISFGYFKKQFAEMKKSAEGVTLYTKDEIGKIAQYKLLTEETPIAETRKVLNMENQQMKQEIAENVMEVIQLTVDSINASGKTLEDIKQLYKV